MSGSSSHLTIITWNSQCRAYVQIRRLVFKIHVFTYKIIHQNGWKQQDFAVSPLMSWAVHIFHCEESSLFLLLAAPGHRLTPRRAGGGFREGEKNVRQVPSPRCYLQDNTRLQACDLPMFPSFYLKSNASGFRTGNRGQTQSGSDCVQFFLFFLSLFFYPKISTLSLRCCYAARNCPSTVYMYSLLFWPAWI